jgi:hypothetical protein
MKHILTVKINQNKFELFNLTNLLRNNPRPTIISSSGTLEELEPRIREALDSGEIFEGEIFYYSVSNNSDVVSKHHKANWKTEKINNKKYYIESFDFEEYKSILKCISLYTESIYKNMTGLIVVDYNQYLVSLDCYDIINDYVNCQYRNRRINIILE